MTRWQHKVERLDGHGYERVQFSSEVTEECPNWCAAHGWAYATRCLACEDQDRAAREVA